MALCRLRHWTFDEGLLGVAADYVVIASRQLHLNDNIPGHLLALERRTIIGPADEALWPDRNALGWHRREVFRRGQPSTS
jgi:putative restriction endonuclease